LLTPPGVCCEILDCCVVSDEHVEIDDEVVSSGAAGQSVTRKGMGSIVSAAAVERVQPILSRQKIVPVTAPQLVMACASADLIAPSSATERIVTTVAV